MLMPKTADLLATGTCPETGFAVAFADVTETARALCRNHLCGPAASRALGEALAGAALLGAGFSSPGDTATLRLAVNGPIQGLCVEAALDEAGIALRGYTNRKVLDALDDSEDPPIRDILGNAATAQFVFSNNGLNPRRASIEVRESLGMSLVFARFYSNSEQQPALVHVAASLYGGYLNYARAFQAMPCHGVEGSGDCELLANKFYDGTVAENLDACLSLADLCAALELSAPENITTRPVRFHCGCSRQRVLGMIERLGTAELQSILNDGVAPEVTCHMCGRGYSITLAEVERFLDDMPF